MTKIEQQGRPAATVVIVRDVADSPPELLMTERSAKMAFAAGALVFPGGAVDEADRVLAASLDSGLDPDEAAARIAAVRETLEESGLGLALTGTFDMAILMEMRAALLAGESLANVLAARDITLDLHALLPFARWHPPAADRPARVFDTRFYLARAPEAQEPTVDATENVRLFWGSAAETIARCDAGEAHIIFPTRRNLERLALFASFEEIAAHAAAIPVEQIRPWVEERDGAHHLCIPAHLGYPVTSEVVATAMRG